MTTNGMQLDEIRELDLLSQIEQDPDISQATLAQELGVAVGTINWHLKRMIEKGYVKVKRAQRKKLRYIITPEGIALRARLTVDYVRNSFNLYRLTRERALHALDELEKAGFNSVSIQGSDEIAEVCRLTCLEKDITVVESDTVPQLVIQGLKIFLELPDRKLKTQSDNLKVR